MITVAHGAGGKMMQELIEKIILSNLTSAKLGVVGLEDLDDGASIDRSMLDGELVFTIDGHTIKPYIFPGGDIGRLSIAGTVNDLAVMGARPLAIAASLIVEEGFDENDLARIVRSMDETAREAEVAIVTGDTKVMERGSIDKIVTATAGIGVAKKVVRDSGLRPGDKIIVTGTIGDHGIAILAAREGFEIEGDLRSDVAPIWETIKAALDVGGVSAMKDPTRGGLAAALNEMAKKSGVDIIIEEERIPIRDSVRATAEMLGIDPLEVTNEGKAIIGVKEEMAEDVLKAIRKTRYGKDAEIIGEVVEGKGRVVLETLVGGKRVLEMPIGDPAPRIC